ncbi:MAG: peptidoglycan DD-metalloendopeptidase family protein [Pseudomonadota bacterium]
MKSLFKKKRPRKAGSLTETARKLSIDDLAVDNTDFFLFPKKKSKNFQLVCLVEFTIFGGAAAAGLALSWPSTTKGVIANSWQTPGIQSASSLVEPASLIQTSRKGDFNGAIAKAVSASPMQPLSVAYIQGQPDTSGVNATGDLLSGSAYPAPGSEALTYGEPIILENSIELAALPETNNSTSVSKTLPPEPVDQEIVLRQGDTLIGRMVELGVTVESARAVAAAIEPVFPGRLVRTGQRYSVTLDKQQDFYGNEVTAPVRVAFTPPGGEELVIESDEDGRYIATMSGKKAEPLSRIANAPHYRAKAKVSSSVYAAARDNGVPGYVINAAMKVLGHSIDLQRQIHAGDQIDLFYGNPLSGSSTKRKVLHYARLRTSGRDHIYYRFTDRNGKTAYYDENGVGANKSLMRTPISGARITSGFGMRRHPLLGYNKLHTGIDFGAPRGTPIKAAGDGVVVHAGWRGSYGRTVVIKHAKKYSTLYAHMSKTAKLKKGQKVRQGQVIGYVGTTGRSTGPHLHYEVRKSGRPINPRRVQVASSGRKLKGKDLKAFKQQKRRVLALMQEAPSSIQIAQVNGQ